MNGTSSSLKIEYGDFQTPLEFSNLICEYIRDEVTCNPSAVLEPTCGIGNFLDAAKNTFRSSKFFGIEKNLEYYNFAKSRFNKEAMLYNEDFFKFDLDKIKNQIIGESLLIIGNPPWVNNSVISSIGGSNVPQKRNFKRLKGLEAITGSSNFDISEFIFIQLISAFVGTNTTIALLCKTTVAKNVFEELNRKKIDNFRCRMVLFDAQKVFNVSVDACLFVVELLSVNIADKKCDIYHLNAQKDIITSFGYSKGKLYSRLDESFLAIDGKCSLEWRQGVKHDCSKVMELVEDGVGYINGKKEKIDIEDLYVYPLIKSSHIKTPIITKGKKSVIVTQKKARENTSHIQEVAPLTWKYLNHNIENFEKRKSSIYKNAPNFSMFGVGDYSYSKYKVAISGFYKKPLFALCYNEKPMMLDDTCYFLSFNSYDVAYTAMLFLNSEQVQSFLKSIAFVDSKRPYTKKILERIDFGKASEYITLADLVKTEKTLGISHVITSEMLSAFLKNVCEKGDLPNTQ